MKLICVDPIHVPEIWPVVSDRIREAMRRGDLGSFKSVELSVYQGNALLWLVTDGAGIFAAIVTQLEESEWRRVCCIVACGGRGRHKWLHLISKLESYARDEGCTAMRILGRKGWQRVLEDYKPRRVILEKELH